MNVELTPEEVDAITVSLRYSKLALESSGDDSYESRRARLDTVDRILAKLRES